MSVETARGALLGLAMGDALALPAEYHRHARAGWGRNVLWEKNAELDQQHVSRPLLPFGLSNTEHKAMCGTDDTETAATAALVLLGTAEHDLDSLFRGWRAHYVDTDGVWCGVAERGAVVATLKGYAPPVTGSDNPVYWDDGAVPAAVSIGLHHEGDPGTARRVAEDYARITHARDGVWAAGAMAHAVSSLAAGECLRPALEEAERTVPCDSWLHRGFERTAVVERDSTGDVFDTVPALIDTFGRPGYSHGGVAPETLPLAFTITRMVDADLTTGLQTAALFPRQSDSLPAMVGALCGAVGGERRIPRAWHERVNRLEGVLLPGVTGQCLTDLADRMTNHRATVSCRVL
ncbi:ADP-ribosylglycohydrolase family protein [Nocardiopsis sp. NPDC007018]|uniref:ADP-ribosylglycohydrolase family protein n=1 Tax=Nocardiopsis sp. NPDC007018 TaxID=3155721 RepID=UPI0033FED8AF